MRKTNYLVYGFVILALLLATSTVAAKSNPFPKIISLPNDFRPEGIVSGYGTDFYAGSLANGSIYKGDLQSGEGGILVQGQDGSIAVGLAFDERTGFLFVAGGTTASAAVYDTRTGEQMGFFPISGAGFVNDVIVTPSAAYFTDSFQAVLYRLPLSPDGSLPNPATIQALPLSGDWTQIPGFNANGIEATPNGKDLIVVNSTAGELFRVDPQSGVASRIDLGGASVSSGDGLLLEGFTLYVVRNQLNQIAVINLAQDLSSGEMVNNLTDANFDVPTTLTGFGNHLYAVNARFGTPPTPYTEYTVVKLVK